MGSSTDVDPAAFGDASDNGIDVEALHPSLTVSAERCKALLTRVAEAEGVRISRLTVVLADHLTVLDLNRRFLDHDYHTDVLAFDYGESDDSVEGEIYVDLDTAQERCTEFEAEFEDEAFRYAVHGLLHLAGYSDKTTKGKQAMRALEDRYLAELG